MKRPQATSTFACITGRREPLTRVLLSTFAARFRRRHFLTSLLAIMMLCTPRFFITAQLQSNSGAPTAFDIVEATVDDVQAALRSGRATCRELVDLYLARIKSYDKIGPALNAIQTVNGRVQREA